MFRVGKYMLLNLLWNKVIIGYFVLLMVCGWGMFLLESQPEKVLLILLQVTLIVLPMITMVFASVYYYNSSEFIELMLAQPIGRFAVFRSFYFCLSFAFVLGFLLGICLPLFIFHPGIQSVFLTIGGVLLITAFIALALFISVKNKDKTRGLGITLLLWAFFAFVYDGLLLFIMYQFSDYPIERSILLLTFLNPIDITRILIIMKTDTSAMLGLSGAVFQQFFGSISGALVSLTMLVVWSALPFSLAWWGFSRKDF